MQDEKMEEMAKDVQTFEKYELSEKEVSRILSSVESLAPNQEVHGAVKNPTNDDLIYFTTDSFDWDANEVLISVFEYNVNDFTWERLFRKTYDVGQNKENAFPGMEKYGRPVLTPVGYDSGALIFGVVDSDWSPGPNDDVSSPYFYYVSMDLENPYGGFEEYELPEEVTVTGPSEEWSLRLPVGYIVNPSDPIHTGIGYDGWPFNGPATRIPLVRASANNLEGPSPITVEIFRIPSVPLEEWFNPIEGETLPSSERSIAGYPFVYGVNPYGISPTYHLALQQTNGWVLYIETFAKDPVEFEVEIQQLVEGFSATK